MGSPNLGIGGNTPSPIQEGIEIVAEKPHYRAEEGNLFIGNRCCTVTKGGVPLSHADVEQLAELLNKSLNKETISSGEKWHLNKDSVKVLSGGTTNVLTTKGDYSTNFQAFLASTARVNDVAQRALSQNPLQTDSKKEPAKTQNTSQNGEAPKTSAPVRQMIYLDQTDVPSSKTDPRINPRIPKDLPPPPNLQAPVAQAPEATVSKDTTAQSTDVEAPKSQTPQPDIANIPLPTITANSTPPPKFEDLPPPPNTQTPVSKDATATVQDSKASTADVEAPKSQTLQSQEGVQQTGSVTTEAKVAAKPSALVSIANEMVKNNKSAGEYVKHTLDQLINYKQGNNDPHFDKEIEALKKVSSALEHVSAQMDDTLNTLLKTTDETELNSASQSLVELLNSETFTSLVDSVKTYTSLYSDLLVKLDTPVGKTKETPVDTMGKLKQSANNREIELSVNDTAIKPIQHLAQLPLIIGELAKATAKSFPDSPATNNFTAAVGKAKEAGIAINRSQAEADLNKVDKLISACISGSSGTSKRMSWVQNSRITIVNGHLELKKKSILPGQNETIKPKGAEAILKIVTSAQTNDISPAKIADTIAKLESIPEFKKFITSDENVEKEYNNFKEQNARNVALGPLAREDSFNLLPSVDSGDEGGKIEQTEQIEQTGEVEQTEQMQQAEPLSQSAPEVPQETEKLSDEQIGKLVGTLSGLGIEGDLGDETEVPQTATKADVDALFDGTKPAIATKNDVVGLMARIKQMATADSAEVTDDFSQLAGG